MSSRRSTTDKNLICVTAVPVPLRFEPAHAAASTSRSGSRAVLLESHCSDSSVPDPSGAETGRQRLEWTPSDLPVGVRRGKIYKVRSYRCYCWSQIPSESLIAAAHRRKTSFLTCSCYHIHSVNCDWVAWRIHLHLTFENGKCELLSSERKRSKLFTKLFRH